VDDLLPRIGASRGVGIGDGVAVGAGDGVADGVDVGVAAGGNVDFGSAVTIGEGTAGGEGTRVGDSAERQAPKARQATTTYERRERETESLAGIDHLDTRLQSAASNEARIGADLSTNYRTARMVGLVVRPPVGLQLAYVVARVQPKARDPRTPSRRAN
jgi:hypothetical protein